MFTIALVLFISLIATFAIHTATRALVGARADTLPGGSLVFVVALVMMSPAAWWMTAPAAVVGAVLGHCLSIRCWRSVRTKDSLGG